MDREWYKTWFDSPYYHVLYQNRNYGEAEKFITTLLEKLELPANTKCLDLACGNGRHSIFLNKYGLDVTGLDLSPKNIAEAKRFENDTLHFAVHDMREVYKKDAFEVVFNFFTSFGYFDDFSENRSVLQSIYEMLRADGKLVIDFFNLDNVLENLVEKEIKTINDIEFHLSRFFDGTHVIKQIEFEDAGKKHRFQEKVQAIRRADFQKMLEETGFELTDVRGDFNLLPFDERNSERLILFAQKQKY